MAFDRVPRPRYSMLWGIPLLIEIVSGIALVDEGHTIIGGSMVLSGAVAYIALMYEHTEYDADCAPRDRWPS